MENSVSTLLKSQSITHQYLRILIEQNQKGRALDAAEMAAARNAAVIDLTSALGIDPKAVGFALDGEDGSGSH